MPSWLEPYVDTKKNRRMIRVPDPETKEGKLTTYARYLMEQHLGFTLEADETVDHINGDKLDDRIENLQVMSLGDNIRKSKRTTPFIFICLKCGEETIIPISKYKPNQTRFCSRSCATSYRNSNKVTK